MKDLTHYFQSSPPSCFNSSVSPSNRLNETETSLLLDENNKNTDETKSVTPSVRKEKLKNKDKSKSRLLGESSKESVECQNSEVVGRDSNLVSTQERDEVANSIGDSEKKVSEYKSKLTSSSSSLSTAVKCKPKPKKNKKDEGKEIQSPKYIKSNVNGVFSDSKAENNIKITSSVVEVINVESNDIPTIVDGKSTSDKTNQSPNVFQILMSTQQIFSSTNSGKIESSEVSENKETSKNENKRKIKESLELMSKRKLEMERLCRSPENSIERLSKRRRRIIEESDSDEDSCIIQIPANTNSKSSVATPQNAGKGKSKLKLPELDVIIKDDLNSCERVGKEILSSKRTEPEKNVRSGSVDSDVLVVEIDDEKAAAGSTAYKSNGIAIESSMKLSRKTKTEEGSSSKKKRKAEAQSDTKANRKSVNVISEDTHISDCEQGSEERSEGVSVGIPPGNEVRETNSSKNSTKKIKNKSVKTASSIKKCSSEDKNVCEELYSENNSISEKRTSEIESKISSNKIKSVNVEVKNGVLSDQNTDADIKVPGSLDTKRKSNIMNYFNKVSSEEDRRQSDKIKVQAEIHFPSVAPEKSSRKSITKSRSKKRGSKEKEDDIVVVNSEIIENSPEGHSAKSSKPSDVSAANNSLQLDDSKEKDPVNVHPPESKSSKLSLSYSWRIRLSDSGVDNSAAKKRVKRDTPPQVCKRLKLTSNSSGKCEKELPTSCSVPQNKQEDTTNTMMNVKSVANKEAKGTTKFKLSETNDKVIEELAMTETPSSVPEDSKSFKKYYNENREEFLRTAKTYLSTGKNNELSKKSENDPREECTAKPKTVGEKNKPGMKQSSLTFKSLSLISKKESVKTPVGARNKEKLSSEKCSPSRIKSKLESSAAKRKSVNVDEISKNKEETTSKKSTMKESTPGKQVDQIRGNESTPGKKLTPKRATKVDASDLTPSKEGSPKKRANSMETSAFAKKTRASGNDIRADGKSDVCRDETDVVDTPGRSRRSRRALPEDMSSEIKVSSTVPKKSTPGRKRGTGVKQQDAAEEVTNPESGVRRPLRLRLKRVVSVDEESSDSWRSVSPESVVDLGDDEDDEDVYDEPIIMRKKKKAVNDKKVSDSEILQLMAERRVVVQAIKKARGKLAKLLNSGENNVTAQRNGGGVSINEGGGGKKVANMKLAPVFMNKLKRPDKATLQAKKQFLQSGVPEEVKKMVEIQKVAEDLIEEHLEFPAVSHVQQRDDSHGNMWDLEDLTHKFPCKTDPEIVDVARQLPLGIFTRCNWSESSESKQYTAGRPPRINVFRNFLRAVKAESPHFPVYRTFRSLYCLNHPLAASDAAATIAKTKKKRRNSSSLKKSQEAETKAPDCSQASWSSKYRPQSSEDILGNNQCVKKLKSWLELWVQAKEGHGKALSGQSDAGSEDDFINDESGDDDDKKVSLPKNPVVILGPNGSGKTMTVYTLARELGFKVLELNAASKRTGRRILSELLEATQSHHVQSKGDEANQKNIKNFFSAKQKPAAKKEKQKERTKAKNKEQEKQNNKLSLILVEDVDVVFEDQDEGFVSALSTLVAGSKRPIVLVSSDPTCSHLSRFVEKSLVLEFKPVTPKILGVWLQLVCLLEGVRVKRSAMEDLLLQNRGDVRKSLLQLQFWVLSGGSIAQPLADNAPDVEEDIQNLSDESSNSSWVSVMDGKKANVGTFPCHSGCAETFLSSDPCAVKVDRGKLWWNVPGVLGLNPVSHYQQTGPVFVEGDGPVVSTINDSSVAVKVTDSELSETVVKDANVVTDNGSKDLVENDVAQWRSVCANEDMSVMSALADTLSLVEGFSRFSEVPLCEPDECLWESRPTDSLSLNEDTRDCCFADERLSRSLGSWLVAESVGQCADRLRPNGEHLLAEKLQKNISDQELRWRRDHHTASLELAEAVPMSYWVERRALSVDYVSSLRSISRLEQGRSCINGKRNNRFFHYLKGLGVDPASGMLETACTAFLSNIDS